MKALNYIFESEKSLENFIHSNSIKGGFQHILVQIFSGVLDETYILRIINILKQHIPDVKIIGSSTDGEIACGSINENSTVISFSIFEKTVVETYYTSQQKSSEILAEKLYNNFKDKKDCSLMISFTDGLNTNGEEFLKYFEKQDKGLIIAGGLAGDNAKFERTLIYDENGVYDNGVVAAVLFSKDLIIGTSNSFGWKKIGKDLKITKAKDNIVYTIDDIEASKVYEKYLGEEIANELPATGIEFPLIISRNNIDIARAVIGKNSEDNSLVFAGNINTGESVNFGYGDIDSIKSISFDVYNNMVKNPIESIFIYSCMARKRLMGEMIVSELLPFSKIAPTSGFFTYGELFTKNRKYELLNQTMTILTLSENKDSINSYAEESNIYIKDSQKTINALTHLVSVTTQELYKLNEILQYNVEDEVRKNREKDKQLLQQSRLAQMGELISMIAHQWRQPLSAIGGAAAGLKVKAQLKKVNNDMVIDICDKILYSSEYLSSTIDDFRTFYKSNKETQELNFNEIMSGVLNIVRIAIESKNIRLEVDIQNNENIRSYHNEIKQVIMNLIKNAEDALLEKNIENPYIKIIAYKDGDEFIIKVKDNAGGIDEAIQEKIFDPYFSTKDKNGTGLGLYMSKTIIENHCQGKLYVKNDDDGAVFIVKIKNL